MTSFLVDESGNFVRIETDGGLLVTQQPGAQPTCTLTFQDVLGDPLPPRVYVQIYNASDPPYDVPLATGFLGYGSQIICQLEPGNLYRVQYSGDNPPSIATTFQAALATTIIPDYYVSPWANLEGYGFEQAQVLFQKGRAASSELQPGGSLYVMFETFAAVMAQLDQFNRIVDQGLRLDSCDLGITLSQNDSWAADFFGSNLPDLPNSDPGFAAGIHNWFLQKFTTIEAVATQVYNFFQQNPDLSTYALVFDWKTDPQRAAYYNLPHGSVAILEAFTTIGPWFAGISYAGVNTFAGPPPAGWEVLQAPQYPGLDALVRRVLAAGIEPYYIFAFTEPPWF